MNLVKLGELASIQTGKIDVNKAVVGGKYPFFTCSREAYEINDAPFEGKAVLVAGNGDLNVKYYEGKFNAYQRTYFLFANNENELIPRYLYWFLESYVGRLRSESIGSTIKYIKMGNLTEAEIPLPSLEKQREIVEKLDSAFADIDLLEANLSLSEGKANQLLDSLLSSAFLSTKGEIDHVHSLDDLVIEPQNVELSDFNKVFTVIPDSKSKIKSSAYLESGKYAVVDQGKQLISGYTNGSSTVDRSMLPVIVFGDHTRAVKYIDFPFTAGADGTQILKPSSSANPRFCFYLVLHAVGQIPSKGYARHFGELKKREFLFPDIAIQNRVVENLDATFAEIASFKDQVLRRQNAASDLRQSLLSNAVNQALGVS